MNRNKLEVWAGPPKAARLFRLFAFLFALGIFTLPAFSYDQCLGDEKGEPIAHIPDDKRAGRDTAPGWLCTEYFEVDRVVYKATCTVFYPTGPNGGTHACKLGVPCFFNTRFVQINEEMQGDKKRICVLVERTDGNFVQERLLIRTYRP